MMRSLAVLCGCLCVAGGPGFAAGLTGAQTGAIDQVVGQSLQATGVPGASVAIVKDGVLVYVHAYGMARLPGQKAAAGMVFPLGSVSKQFTASLILLLAQDGALSLDDKVGRFLPDLAGANEVSIRQVLSHTAGYEDFAPEDYMTPAMTRATTPQAVVADWGRRALDFVPGTQWQYSNTGYAIAALIAEKAGRAPFFTQLRARILDRLQLGSAVDYDAKGLPPGSPAGYQRYALGPPRPALPDEPGWSFGSGQLAMSVSDLAKWDIGLMTRRLLSAASYDAMETPMRLANGTECGYGLGVRLREAGDHQGIYHGGEETGFTAYNEVFAKDRAAVAVFTNQDATPAAEVIARRIEAIAFGIPVVVPGDAAERQLVSLLTDLAEGHIDRAQLNANAHFYFSPVALADFRASLAPLGPLLGVHERSHEARGGMMLHEYDVSYLSRRLSVTTYRLPDGRLGQLIVTE